MPLARWLGFTSKLSSRYTSSKAQRATKNFYSAPTQTALNLTHYRIHAQTPPVRAKGLCATPPVSREKASSTNHLLSTSQDTLLTVDTLSTHSLVVQILITTTNGHTHAYLVHPLFLALALAHAGHGHTQDKHTRFTLSFWPFLCLLPFTAHIHRCINNNNNHQQPGQREDTGREKCSKLGLPNFSRSSPSPFALFTEYSQVALCVNSGHIFHRLRRKEDFCFSLSQAQFYKQYTGSGECVCFVCLLILPRRLQSAQQSPGDAGVHLHGHAEWQIRTFHSIPPLT